MISGHRNHATYWAFALHRVSGLALALFLPAHFSVLVQAIENEAGFDGFLKWSEQPLVKLAEAGLIVLLALHMTGGIRLLAVEFLPWRDGQKTFVAVTGGLSVAAGLLFLVNAV
ncbi:MAG: succinate dehydrogenase, cytochrome b556 subunit [Rhodospirillales bacterium]|nr:succinate dehydrogenase, cytochrome b556 subunit [Rhodospirillales bacterium]